MKKKMRSPEYIQSINGIYNYESLLVSPEKNRNP